jgi:hypothetical protein
LASPMSAAPDSTDDAEDADGAVVVYCGEDRRDRDTKLSRASDPRVAGPRLRSSWLWSVVSGEVFPLYRKLSWRTRERSRLIILFLILALSVT